MVEKLSHQKRISLICAVSIIVGFFSNSCSNNSAVVNPQLVFKDDINKIIVNYTDSFPQFNTFYLKESSSLFSITENLPHGFLLGPGYEELIEDKHFMKNGDLSIFWEFSGRRVYYISTLTNLLQCDTATKWENKYVADSMIIGKNNPIVIKNRVNLYMMKAIYFYYDKGKLIVNHHPDTLFMPQYSDIRLPTPFD